MKALLAIAVTPALIFGAAACTNAATPSKPSRSASRTAGVVTYKQYTHLTSPSPYCKNNPTALGCKPRWVLEIRTKAGSHRTFDVSKATFKHCRLNDHYPACVNGVR